jgi:hypothetical protein
MIVGVWWYLRPDPVAVQEVDEVTAVDYDELVTQIAVLDEAHDQGEINGSDYTRYRAQLVRQATALMPRSPEEDAASPSPSY